MRHARLFTVLFFCLFITLNAVSGFSAAADYESVEAGLDSSPGAGTDAVLVIDVSGSMMDSDPEYHCREAALSFVRELRSG